MYSECKVIKAHTHTRANKHLNSLSDKLLYWQIAVGSLLMESLCCCNPSAARKCEYDEDTNEYWVNIRTEGVLSREDIEELSRKRSHEQDTAVGADFFLGCLTVWMS